MNRKYNDILRKIYLAGILCVLLIFMKPVVQYVGNKARIYTLPNRSDQHYITRNTTTTATTIKVPMGTNTTTARIYSTVKPQRVIKKYVLSWKYPLDFIPDISVTEKSAKVPYLSENITKKYLELPNIKYQDKIAILTPIRNAERALGIYGNQVQSLSYPHELISIYFGEDGSIDNTFEKATKIAHELQIRGNFMKGMAIKLNISGGFLGPMVKRQIKEYQENRRAHMALARNRLLRFALRQNKADYILWIDSDVAELPLDLVQQMLFAKSDVVNTCCLQKKLGYKMRYDCNSWRETNASMKYQSNLEPDCLVVEGYSKTMRLTLPDLKSEGRVVPLDGVGGCALLVKADCHRSGLQFPEVVYKHHIETEGLAKMAHDMGYSVVGLPFVEVIHQ